VKIIVETTGIAKPAPIIQSFFADPKVQASCRLDAVITLVDSKNVWNHIKLLHKGKGEQAVHSHSLWSASRIDSAAAESKEKGEVQRTHDGREEVVEQIAYADRIILNKSDLVSESELEQVSHASLPLVSHNHNGAPLACSSGSWSTHSTNAPTC
jgi:G3E family GTPase